MAQPAHDSGRPRLLIINGLPASGKSTLGSALAPLLGLPLFSKDLLKEIMFDQAGWRDRAWSQRVGRAAWELLWTIAEQELRASRSVAIESNFVPAVADRRLAAFRARFPLRAIELHCAADRQVIIDRFIARATSGSNSPAENRRRSSSSDSSSHRAP